jgi:hypothetical protein
MPDAKKVPILPEAGAGTAYDPGCRRCARLVAFLDAVRAEHPAYCCRPVPPFGPADATLVIVGLAPGMHGANASGRPFTGDYAGILLYETLHAFGFASRPASTSRDDGLALVACRITNAVKCLPPLTGQRRRNTRLQRLPRRRSGAPPTARSWRWPHRAMRRCARGAFRHTHAHGARHSLERVARLRQLSLQPLQHEH